MRCSDLTSRPRGERLYRTIYSARLYEQIVEQIEAAIVGGELKPGEQLPAERELALRFGVSRTAVREAIKALREKGLVQPLSGRGTFVTNGKSQAMRQSFDMLVKFDGDEGSTDLAELRSILEPDIAALAAVRGEEQHFAALREAVSKMDASSDDADGFVEADLDFHLALAEAARNPLILSLIDSIVGLLREQRIGIFFVEGGPERGQHHHKQILEAVVNRNGEAARQAMRAHLEQVREDSARAIREGRLAVQASGAKA
jgi:GntR family transcriptional regulator, transcriptional repressor for pyruvate dehydrogenase complex